MEPYVQLGSFGILAFMIGWFVLKGVPKMAEVLGTAVERTFNKIDAIEVASREERSRIEDASRLERQKMEEACRLERLETAKLFREMLIESHKNFQAQLTSLIATLREEGEADRTARHEQGSMFQKALADLFIAVQASPPKPGVTNG